MGNRMPTKTRSPSWISRDAAATMSSGAVKSLITEVRRHRGSWKLDANRVEVDALHVCRPVCDLHHPFAQPAIEAVRRTRPCRVLAVERMVALVVALHRRRMRPAGLVDNGHDPGLRKLDSVRVAQDHRGVHELLAGDDHALRSEAGFLGD